MTNDSSADQPSVFKLRDFRLLVVGQIGQWFGRSMTMLGVMWHIYDLTGDPFALGLVGLSLFIPSVIVILPAGDFADRHDRRVIQIIGNSLMALCTAGLTALAFTDTRDPWAYYAVMGLFGAAGAFTRPSGRAFTSSLVPRAQLATAFAWTSSISQTAAIAGPVLAGVIYLAGPGFVFATVSVLYVTVTLAISAIRTSGRQMDTTELDDTAWQRLKAGVSFVRRQPIVLGAMSLDMFAMFMGDATALLPIFAKDILDVGPIGLGVLRSAPAAGAVITAIVLAHMPERRNTGVMMFAAVASYGVFVMVFGLSTNVVLSFAALFMMGAADMVSVNFRQTVIQLATPDRMRGRVGSVNSLFVSATTELGDFESGAMASLLGAVPAVLVGGTCAIGIAGFWMWAFPALRDVDRMSEVKAG